MDMWHDMGHMSNLSKGLKKKSFFGGGDTRFWSGRESEKGREKKKKIKTFIFNPQSSVGWNSPSQE